MTKPTSDPTNDLSLSAVVAGQFSYHVRMSAAFALAGESEPSASEAVLAWTILATCWPGVPHSAAETAAELVGAARSMPSEQQRRAIRNRAHAAALDLQAHYVSVGRHDAADLYASVEQHVDGALDALTTS